MLEQHASTALKISSIMFNQKEIQINFCEIYCSEIQRICKKTPVEETLAPPVILFIHCLLPQPVLEATKDMWRSTEKYPEKCLA